MLVALLSMMACTNELDNMQVSGEEVTVTFEAGVLDGVQTRAFNDGTSAKELYYAVFVDSDDDTVTPIESQSGTMHSDNGQWTVPFTLVRGMKYNIVFWAQNAAAPYTFDAKTGVVTANYEATEEANDDKFDAFYYTLPYEVKGSGVQTIKLTRAVAQINVATSDMTTAEAAGLDAIGKVKMVVKGAQNQFNTLKKTASGAVDALTFEADYSQLADKKITIDETEYDALIRNYILTDGGNVTCDFEIAYSTTNSDVDSKVSYTDINNVPVTTNYRTNIYGALLTDPATLQLKVDNKNNDGFFSPDEVHPVNAVTTNTAANELLTGAVTNDNTPAQAAMDASSDVNAVEVPSTFVSTGSTEDPASVSANWDKAPESLNFGEEDQTETEQIEKAVPAYSTLKTTATAAGSTTTVNSFGPNSHSLFAAPEDKTWNITTMNAGAGLSTLVIGKGVTIETLNLYYGNLVIDGGTVVDLNHKGTGNIYYVGNVTGEIKDNDNTGKFIKLASVEELALRNAIANTDVESYTLTSDVLVSNQLVVDRTFTLDLNGYKIYNETDIWNGTTKAWSVISVQGENGNLTINGNGTIHGKANDCYAADARDNATLTINGGKYLGNWSTIYAINGAKININGGEYSVQQTADTGDPYGYILNMKDSGEGVAASEIKVTGGTFHKFNPAESTSENPQANFVAEGYVSYQDGENYVVVDRETEIPVTTAAMLEAAAVQGGKVKLAADIQLSRPVIVRKNLVVDMAGHSVTAAATLAANTDAGAASTSNQALIYITKESQLTLTGNGTVDAAEHLYGIIMTENKIDTGKDATKIAKLKVVNATIKAKHAPICGMGSRPGTEINLDNATVVSSNAWAIYHPQVGTLNIRNSNLTGNNGAVEMRSGTLTIDGGTYTATTTEFKKEPNNSGSTVEGAAIAISQHTTNNAVSVTISNGVFNGIYGLYEEDLHAEPTTVGITINGGTFNGMIESLSASKFEVKGGTFNNFYNGVSYTVADKTYTITTKEGLFWFADIVNKEKTSVLAPANGQFYGMTVALGNSIDLNNEPWNPVGQTGTNGFLGVFDGKNFTISNLKVDSSKNMDKITASGSNYSNGFFGWVESGNRIQNLNIDKATITGHNYAGVIVGHGNGFSIENCHVSNSSITVAPVYSELFSSSNKYDLGDKAGGIIGYADNKCSIKSCSVDNVTVKGYRDLGGIVGNSECDVISCSASEVHIIQDNTNGYKDKVTTYGPIIGRTNTGTVSLDGVSCSYTGYTSEVIPAAAE